MLRLVKTGVEGERPCTDVLEINRPGDLGDIASLGLTLAEAKRLLAGVQQEIVAAQAKEHAVRRPDCSRCGRVCQVKDYRDHAVATLSGQVTVRLARFRCAACGGIEAGVGWPPHCRSTPELDRPQTHLCAVMTYLSLGVSPDCGDTVGTVRAAGVRGALELYLLRDRITAVEAQRFGLVNLVVPAAGLDEELDRIAAHICRLPQLAVSNTKRLVRQAPTTALAEQLEGEGQDLIACTQTESFQRAVAAFLKQ